MLTSKYSSIPYLEPSLPRPDCFTPPNGATCIITEDLISQNNLSPCYSSKEYKMHPTSVEISPSLTPTSPYSRASVTRHERCILFVKIYAANPASLKAKDTTAWPQISLQSNINNVRTMNVNFDQHHMGGVALRATHLAHPPTPKKKKKRKKKSHQYKYITNWTYFNRQKITAVKRIPYEGTRDLNGNCFCFVFGGYLILRFHLYCKLSSINEASIL